LAINAFLSTSFEMPAIVFPLSARSVLQC
jgi:hypothetical protein